MVVYNSFKHSRTFTCKKTSVTSSYTSFTKPWILTCTHKHHIISTQYPPHKCLNEKSYLHCLRILIMFWLYKDLVVIMKEIMSWLFKDPISNELAQFDHAQSNNKKWPKMFKLPQMNIFLEKQLIKFSCTYWPLSFCKIF